MPNNIDVYDFDTDGSFTATDATTIRFSNNGSTAATVTEQGTGSSFILLSGIRLPLFAFGGLSATYDVIFDEPTSPDNAVQVIVQNQ